jgi:hypothetical protein
MTVLTFVTIYDAKFKEAHRSNDIDNGDPQIQTLKIQKPLNWSTQNFVKLITLIGLRKCRKGCITDPVIRLL